MACDIPSLPLPVVHPISVGRIPGKLVWCYDLIVYVSVKTERRGGGGGDIQLFHDIKVNKHSNVHIKRNQVRKGRGSTLATLFWGETLVLCTLYNARTSLNLQKLCLNRGNK